MRPYRCPVCDGTGLVSRPPGIAGDQYTWYTTGCGPYSCRACEGSGIIWGQDLEDSKDPDINVCPKCSGPADNGFDRCLPPNPYYCTKCEGT